MPTVFSYVLGRPAALQTIEEIPDAPVDQAPPADAPVEENTNILGDTPQP